MDTLSFPIFPRNTIKKQTLFSINDIQVIFNTDVKTAEKLEDGMCYLNVEYSD